MGNDRLLTGFNISLAGEQIVGKRSRQEDAFRVIQQPEENSIVCILADGMGGHKGGNVAANLAADVFADEISAKNPPYNRQFANLLDQANKALESQIQSDPDLFDMGTTLVCAEIREDQLYWVSVGDSLLLHFSNGKLNRLNADHSMAAKLDKAAERGDITWEEAKNSRSRSALLSALTGEPISRVDISRMPIQLGYDDLLLLASDGIETLHEAELIDILSRLHTAHPEAIVKEILSSIEDKQNESQDNTTIIVLSCHDNVPDPDEVTTRPIMGR